MQGVMSDPLRGEGVQGLILTCHRVLVEVHGLEFGIDEE